MAIFTPNGRLMPVQYNDETFWKHEYNLSDHLGNVRVVFAAHPHGQPEVMQQTSYFPFGMTLQQQNFGGVQSQPNKLLYNSKELQDDELAGVSLDWYDYGARFYDPQIARFHSVDPLAEKYSFQSPFAYAANNPIRFIDYMGLGPDDPNNDITKRQGVWFTFSVNWKILGAGIKGQAGPLKGEANISLVNTEGKISKEGNDYNTSATGTIGNLTLGGGLNNIFDANVSGSVVEGGVQTDDNGIKLNGKALAGEGEISNSSTQSKLKWAGSVFPNESSVEQSNLPVGNNLDNYNFSFEAKLGPVKVGAGANPVTVGAHSAIIADSYAKQATGQRPPSVGFLLLRAVFGIGK